MDKSIETCQWSVRTQHRPILKEDEIDALVAWLSDVTDCSSYPTHSGIPSCGSVVVNGTPMQIPEILFGNNALELCHEPSGLVFLFDARGALKHWVKLFVQGAFEVIKVREAKEWRVRPGTPIKQQEYDWTWGTDYAGSCRQRSAADEHSEDGNILPPVQTLGTDDDSTVVWVACEPGGIDRQLLQDRSSPILMYDEVVLFEDFIHDHGVVRISVKTRIMPQCWFVLLRYWLRVDGVAMKVFDTRCFHKFGEQNVYRERTQYTSTFASLEQRGLATDPSVYANADAALPMLELSSGPFYDYISICTDRAKGN